MSINPFEKAEGFSRLLLRLPAGHSKTSVIEEKLWQTEAGLRGEDRLLGKLDELRPLLPFEALMDISLSAGEEKFQIDCLLLTRQCLILLESKNIRGKLAFDEATGEFTRLDPDGAVTVMANPLYQLEKNKRYLLKWLGEQDIAVPLTGAVVFTSPAAWLQNVPAGAAVIKLQQVPQFVLQRVGSAPQKPETADTAGPLRELLKAENRPFYQGRLCERFGIPFQVLKTGILCPACKAHTVRRRRRSWRCESCGFSDPALHLDALREYVSLTGEPLTNRRLREFWEIDSPDVVYRVLKGLETTTQYRNRHRKYFLNPVEK